MVLITHPHLALKLNFPFIHIYEISDCDANRNYYKASSTTVDVSGVPNLQAVAVPVIP